MKKIVSLALLVSTIASSMQGYDLQKMNNAKKAVSHHVHKVKVAKSEVMGMTHDQDPNIAEAAKLVNTAVSRLRTLAQFIQSDLDQKHADDQQCSPEMLACIKGAVKANSVSAQEFFEDITKIVENIHNIGTKALQCFVDLKKGGISVSVQQRLLALLDNAYDACTAALKATTDIGGSKTIASTTVNSPRSDVSHHKKKHKGRKQHNPVSPK